MTRLPGAFVSAGQQGNFEMSESRTRFYLDKRNGKIMGVCAGIANYLAIAFCAIASFFLWQSFYGMRIRKES
mgnify:CR=1 FL=1